MLKSQKDLEFVHLIVAGTITVIITMKFHMKS